MLTGTNTTTQPRRLTPTTEAVIFDVAPLPTADGAADGQETKWWKLVSASRGPIAVLRAESAGHQGQRHMLGLVPRSFSDWAIRFLVFSSTERFRKKSKRRSKGLGEKRPNPGCFWFTAVGGRFFWRRKNFRVASLGSEWQKMAHTKLILCVSNKLFYQSGYAAPEMQYWQANIFQTTRAGAWPV